MGTSQGKAESDGRFEGGRLGRGPPGLRGSGVCGGGGVRRGVRVGCGRAGHGSATCGRDRVGGAGEALLGLPLELDEAPRGSLAELGSDERAVAPGLLKRLEGVARVEERLDQRADPRLGERVGADPSAGGGDRLLVLATLPVPLDGELEDPVDDDLDARVLGLGPVCQLGGGLGAHRVEERAAGEVDGLFVSAGLEEVLDLPQVGPDALRVEDQVGPVGRHGALRAHLAQRVERLPQRSPAVLRVGIRPQERSEVVARRAAVGLGRQECQDQERFRVLGEDGAVGGVEGQASQCPQVQSVMGG